MYTILEAMVKIVSFSLVLYGLWLLVGSPFLQSEIESLFRKWKRKRKIRRLQELNTIKEEKEKNAIIQHLELLINSVSKKEKKSVFNFIFLIIIIFLVTFTILISD
ncbi:hypothetical protein [Heyndrickxia sporothermodurans]|uniref:hypothetical protein n=1 Tax=Heyndrickxia sporothermodurans TaxID=46224 RepID=UPI00192CBF54|nr:hypothetical protein [Heyndrickxia sporothermodurans]MBL5801450.1 hypothetical protein [Heyndrickxia sporothermodurans]